MSAKVLDIADAIVQALAGQTFSQAILPVRVRVPKWTLEELKTARVSVVPSQRDDSHYSRAARKAELVVTIGIQKYCGPDADAVDAMDLLSEEIVEFLGGQAMADATWIESTCNVLCAPEHFEQDLVYTALYSFTYAWEVAR